MVKINIETSGVAENGETVFDGGRYVRLETCGNSRWRCPVGRKPGAQKRGENCKHAFSHYHYTGGSCNFGVQWDHARKENRVRRRCPE